VNPTGLLIGSGRKRSGEARKCNGLACPANKPPVDTVGNIEGGGVPDRNRSLWWLLVAILLEISFALALRGAATRDLLAGQLTWFNVVAAVGLVWLVVIMGAAWRAWQRDAVLRLRVRESRDSLAAVQVTSHDWLWETTADMSATYCSPAVTELLGYRPEQIVGRPILGFVDPDDVPAAQAIIDHAALARTGWDNAVFRWRHQDGRTLAMQGNAVPILDPAGELVGFRGSRRLVPAHDTHGLTEARARVNGLLERRDLQIALQPIVSIPSGRCTGVEALARFPDGRPPEVWFGEAQHVGLGLDLELLALEQALAVAPSLPEHISISINASPALILDARLADTLTSSGLPLHRLTLEITEHAAVTEYASIKAALLPLRQQGLRLAVDDTGAGYASFNHVLHLRPDVIKLDRSLLTDIATDPARRAFVTAIVLLGLELDATITGEGVETRAELETISLLGIDHAQGYHLGRPDTNPTSWTTWAARTWPAQPPGNDTPAPSIPHAPQPLSDQGLW
jgi:PAS domain S-box-containing protein